MIDITYGFIEDDSFDGISDWCEEDIEYNTDEIIDKMKECADAWEAFIEENERIVSLIRDFN